MGRPNWVVEEELQRVEMEVPRMVQMAVRRRVEWEERLEWELLHPSRHSLPPS